MYSVDIYSRVRPACLNVGMSSQEAARYFNKDRKTIAKMLRHALPPGYRRSEAPRRPTLDAYVGIIDEILCTDKALIKKQRHTAKRIFERLRDEHGYAGSPTTVTYYVREQKSGAPRKSSSLCRIAPAMNFVPVTGHWGTLPQSVKGAPNGTTSTQLYRRL
jgi:hypothetical protein